MSVAVARPGSALTTSSITGAIITSLTSHTSGANGTKFYIKTTSANFQYSVPVVETTGSGDERVSYDHGDKVYGQFSLSGVMLAARAVGIKELVDQLDNTATGDSKFLVKLEFDFSADSTHKMGAMPVIIQQIQIQFDGKSPVVGVALSGQTMAKNTSTFTNDAE